MIICLLHCSYYIFIFNILSTPIIFCTQVLVTFSYNLWFSICLPYNVIALMAEINSVFLHTRKLLQMAGVKFNNPLYRFNNVLNLVTFFVFRLCMIAYLLGRYHHDSHLLSVTYALFTFFAILLVGGVINTVLFWRLFKNDLLRPVPSNVKDSEKDPCNNNKKSTALFEMKNGYKKIN